MRYPFLLVLGHISLGLVISAFGLGTLISGLYVLVHGDWTWWYFDR